MLINAVQSVGQFVKVTAAKVHNKNFLKSLLLTSQNHALIVFDQIVIITKGFETSRDKITYFRHVLLDLL